MCRFQFCLLLICCLAIGLDAQIRFNGNRNRQRPRNRRPPFNRHQGGNQGFRTPVNNNNNFDRQTPRPTQPSPSNQDVRGCNCLDQNRCPQGFGQASTKCFADQGAGICCIKQASNIASRIGPVQAQARTVSASNVQVRTAFTNGDAFLRTLDQKEQQRRSRGKFVRRGTPARAHAYFFQRSKDAKKNHRTAYTIAFASQELAKQEGLSASDSFFSLPRARLRPSGMNCPSDDVPRCDPNAKFRTIDGTCNNLIKPLAGQSATAFKRLLPPLYADGIMEPREKSVEGQDLPRARDVSSTVLIDLNSQSSQLTLMVMQWSQFVDHDITLAPFMDMEGEAIECCEDGREVSPLPEGCFNIKIPRSDKFFPRDQACMNFVRSMLAPMPGCFMGPVEQLNALTHWVDGSMIYGSNEEEKARIVDERTGFMSMSANQLPPTNSTIDCEPRVPSICFAAGDSRVTEQPALTVLHTMWIREHNRIARELQALNPRWNPRQLFEETRRIVIAMVQHISYNDWLPIIIGPSMVRKLGIGTLRSGFRNGYDQNEDPQISNEFATAAFRYGHSMVAGIYRLITNNGRSSAVSLRESFNHPRLFMDAPDLVDSFVRGLVRQQNENMDSFISEDLSNHLFQTPGFKFGMDLMSLNIQRGRDHAISTYSQIRETAGLPKPRDFTDLADVIPQDRIRRLQAVYRNVEDIDMFAGGMTELPVRDGLLGPTFADVVGKQFQRSLEADRFFYDRGNQPGSFTADQLDEIRRHTSLAKILCDNSNVDVMQRDVFRLPNNANRQDDCRNIPGIDLTKWKA